MEKMMPNTREIELTPEMVLWEIWKFHEEWEESGDWWWGTSTPFKGIPVGYDVNVFHDAEGEPFKGVVYQLAKDEEEGYSKSTDEIVFAFPVPTKEEYEREFMIDMDTFVVCKKTKQELKFEALQEILSIDMDSVIDRNTKSATYPQAEEMYTIVIAASARKDTYSAQVYEGTETRKSLRKEMMDVQIKSDGTIVSCGGLEVYSLAEAIEYAAKHPGKTLSDASCVGRTIKCNKDTLKIEVSESELLVKVNPLLKTWVEKPSSFRTAKLMAMHEATYFNGKLVAIDGKENMLVGIGDGLITCDGSEYLVGVYRIDKED
jgi:hypothetical protein